MTAHCARADPFVGDLAHAAGGVESKKQHTKTKERSERDFLVTQTHPQVVGWAASREVPLPDLIVNIGA